MTRFRILATSTEVDGWQEHSEQEAHNAEAAIRAAYMKAPNNVLAMVAVPARSWKPTPIRTESITKIVLGGEPKQEPKEPRGRSGERGEL